MVRAATVLWAISVLLAPALTPCAAQEAPADYMDAVIRSSPA